MRLALKVFLLLAWTSATFGKSIKVQMDFEDIMKLVQNLGGPVNFRKFANSVSNKFDLKTETPISKYNNPYHPEDDKSDTINIKLVKNDFNDDDESEDRERNKILNKSVKLLEKDNDVFISSGKNMIVSEDELTEMIDEISGPPPIKIEEVNKKPELVSIAHDTTTEGKEAPKYLYQPKSRDANGNNKLSDSQGFKALQRRYQVLKESSDSVNKETEDKEIRKHPEPLVLQRSYQALKESFISTNREIEDKETFKRLHKLSSKENNDNEGISDSQNPNVLHKQLLTEPVEPEHQDMSTGLYLLDSEQTKDTSDLQVQKVLQEKNQDLKETFKQLRTEIEDKERAKDVDQLKTKNDNENKETVQLQEQKIWKKDQESGESDISSATERVPIIN